MNKNSLVEMYDGAFAPWKARMALARIKALRFPKCDWPDLMQELAILVVGFKYDPNHVSSATEETALYAAMNRHLLSLMRQRCREHRRFECYLRSLGIREDGTYCGREPSVEPEVPLDVDLTRLLAGLSAFDQKVGSGLARGLTRRQIAVGLDCDWSTVNKAVRRIKAHLQNQGCDGEGL